MFQQFLCDSSGYAVFVILNGAQRSEESRFSFLCWSSFAEFILERSEGLRACPELAEGMTTIKITNSHTLSE
ncbi:MAG: hypothetical protein E3J56_11320 [Candidatus Aminicenantes bacterium]|nr:MAG: hypothetical protein E3J56_11320 [Candidatus Aminicenantes bacterium]